MKRLVEVDLPDTETSMESRPPSSSRSYPVWHRSRLPHFEAGETPQHITFHLADSLPAEVLARWEAELKLQPTDAMEAERRRRCEVYLDAGHGSCALRDPRIAEVVENALLHFHDMRYVLYEWSVMPNHVHTVVMPLGDWTLSSIAHS